MLCYSLVTPVFSHTGREKVIGLLRGGRSRRTAPGQDRWLMRYRQYPVDICRLLAAVQTHQLTSSVTK